jgi:hypothetical protein
MSRVTFQPLLYQKGQVCPKLPPFQGASKSHLINRTNIPGKIVVAHAQRGVSEPVHAAGIPWGSLFRNLSAPCMLPATPAPSLLISRPDPAANASPGQPFPDRIGIRDRFELILQLVVF